MGKGTEVWELIPLRELELQAILWESCEIPQPSSVETAIKAQHSIRFESQDLNQYLESAAALSALTGLLEQPFHLSPCPSNGIAERILLKVLSEVVTRYHHRIRVPRS